jgi:hypothetical protein
VFYDDDGFRDLFIYGSVAMLAALALPTKKAHAAEIYLCDDGRLLELTNSNRNAMTHRDSCVTMWYVERQKATNTKSGQKNAAVAAAAPVDHGVVHSSGYEVQTSAIVPLINAEEVPEGRSMAPVAASREKVKSDKRARRDRAKNSKTAAVSGRALKGLRNMGDGIFAE